MIHPMAALHARSLPADLALQVALQPLGHVVPFGPDGTPMTGPDLAALRTACSALLYECRSCGIARGIDGYDRDSAGVDLCTSCHDEAGVENEHADGLHDLPHVECPDCLDDLVGYVLQTTDPTLSMSMDGADRWTQVIRHTDRTDEDTLRAYDLLHARATFGRAF